MRATALGIGLAMLGGIGIAQAQVPPKPGADSGTEAGRPVLLLPLPNGGYAIAQQNEQGGGAGAGPHGPGMPGMPPTPPRAAMPMMGGQMMGKEGMERHGGMGHHGWMRRGEEQGRGAIFAFRRGDSNIFIRCAVGEPMRACAVAASMLIQQVTSEGHARPPKGPPGRGPNSGVGMPHPGASPPGSPPGTPPTPGGTSGSSSGSSSSSSNATGSGSSTSGGSSQ